MAIWHTQCVFTAPKDNLTVTPEVKKGDTVFMWITTATRQRKEMLDAARKAASFIYDFDDIAPSFQSTFK